MAYRATETNFLFSRRPDLISVQTGTLTAPYPTTPNSVANKQYVDDTVPDYVFSDPLTATGVTIGVKAAGASDSGVITTGAQTLAGVKTFNGAVRVPAPLVDADAATKKYVDDTVPDYVFADPLTAAGVNIGIKSASGTDAGVMTIGAQTFAGVKTFNDAVRVPAPLVDADAATKKYVDDTVVDYVFADPLTTAGANIGIKSASGTDAGIITIGAQTFAGVKTFNDAVRVPAPLVDTDAATKKYVDDSVVDYVFGYPLTTAGANIGIGQASLIDSGVVTTAAQSFAGDKTFKGILQLNDVTDTYWTKFASTFPGELNILTSEGLPTTKLFYNGNQIYPLTLSTTTEIEIACTGGAWTAATNPMKANMTKIGGMVFMVVHGNFHSATATDSTIGFGLMPEEYRPVLSHYSPEGAEFWNPCVKTMSNAITTLGTFRVDYLGNMSVAYGLANENFTIGTNSGYYSFTTSWPTAY